MKRGYTLIEVMIAVACIGIVSALSSTFILENRAAGKALLLQERALQALEAEAAAAAHGAQVDAATRARLLADLPGGRIEERREGDFTIARVTWSVGGKARSAELAVVRK